MRILDVAPSPHFPPDRGGSIRVYNLLRHLSQKHEIRQFTAVTSDRWWPAVSVSRIDETYLQHRYSHPVESLGHTISRSLWQRGSVLSGLALRLCKPRHLFELLKWADLILVEYPWQFDVCYNLFPQGRFVLASHNVEADMYQSVAKASRRRVDSSRRARYVENIEGRAVTRAELVLAVSPADRREFVSRYGADPGRVVEIPNGADTDKLVPVGPSEKAAMKRRLGLPDKPLVIFANSLYAPAGRPAFQWIDRLARAHSRFTFLVAGSLFPAPAQRGNLLITGPVDDIAPYFQAADIALCPVESGGGTKIKLMESLACGLPSVAFAESVQGTLFQHGEHLLIAENNEQSLALALYRIANNPDFAERLGRAGRQVVVKHHDWKRIAEKLDLELTTLANGIPRRAAGAFAASAG